MRGRRRLVAATAAIGVLALLAGCAPVSPAAPGADPVLIVGGTGAPASFYEPLANRLRAGGYDVSIYEIPSPLDPFDASAATYQQWFDAELDRLGTDTVDVIGHSQGVILMRYAARFLGGAPHLDTMVSLSGGIYGSNLASLLDISPLECLGLELCQQAATGSEFLRELNSPTDTLPGVHHVNFSTIYEEIALPHTNNLMRGSGDFTNVTVQDQCPARIVEHMTMATDGAVASGIDDALAHRPITLDCLAL
jgi:pimeloyl-ACP methyl ester carboxylesterase